MSATGGSWGGYYRAQNAIPITQVGFTQLSTVPPIGKSSLPFNKLSAFVNNTDAVMQLMTDPSGGWQDDSGQEILLRIGFNARDPLPLFYAVRFKVWNGTLLGTTGTVDLTMMLIP